MVKNLSVYTIPVHAGKPLNRKARGNFNDYPIRQKPTGVRRQAWRG